MQRGTTLRKVVRAAVRHMQEGEDREARLARAAANDILDQSTADQKAAILERVRAGFDAIERGEYTDCNGREGLVRLAAGVKARGRKLLADRAPDVRE